MDGPLVLLHVVGALEGLAAKEALSGLDGSVLNPDVARQVDPGHDALTVRAAGQAWGHTPE
jgi:hypothetical protein